MRNLTFYNTVTAIYQLWDWGWTYKSISITNCSIGLDMSNGGHDGQTVGSVTLIDSSITDTPIGILTAHNATSQPPTGGSLIVENVQLKNVPIAIQGPGSTTVLAGSAGALMITAWGQGHSYTPTGPTSFEGPIASFPRPDSLLLGGKFYERSKPQYANLPVSRFLSVRDLGAKGDGVTDDSVALNAILKIASKAGKIVFFDAGIYLVKSTISVPAGSKIIGETYPLIMGSGAFFSDMSSPQPVVRVGQQGGQRGDAVEWSDMIVATQGAAAGAVLIEWNLHSPDNMPSGMWDVHTRIGGFTGSNLQVAQCLKTPSQNITSVAGVNANCIAAFMAMHITKSASSLYLENVWLWTADHDMDDPGLAQITIYAGRGLFIESSKGAIWL
jgi:glucan 1,3-beta-glucosidase